MLLGVEVELSEKTRACWTKPVPVAELANKAVHGHVFRLQPDGTFVPYELQEGEVDAKIASINGGFFQDFAGFLRDNNLADLVALQVLDGDQHGPTKTELLVGPQSTLMVDQEDLIGFEPARITTGWSFHVAEDGIISCKGDNVYAAKKHTHAVFQDSKPLPTVEALREALRDEGVIA